MRECADTPQPLNFREFIFHALGRIELLKRVSGMGIAM
jgi:hypothetical protein